MGLSPPPLPWALAMIGACVDAVAWSRGRTAEDAAAGAIPDWRRWIASKMSGRGDGYGHGYGYGSGSGYGYGYGDGNGDGDGSGYGYAGFSDIVAVEVEGERWDAERVLAHAVELL